MTEVDLIRTNHLIDPGLHIWNWEIPVYLFLGGITAGIMILSVLLQKNVLAKNTTPSTSLRWLPFLAPVLITLGMIALFLDLSFKLHVYRFYFALQPLSPMSWGAWILLAIYPATLLLGLAGLDSIPKVPMKFFACALARLHTFSINHRSNIFSLNLILGVGLGIYTGILLSNLGRPVWNSAVLGPLFLVSGISTGAALMSLFPLGTKEKHLLHSWDQLAIITEIVLIILYVINLETPIFWGDPYTAMFWSLIVGLGLVVPLLMHFIGSLRHLPVSHFIPALVLLGGFMLRWVLVMAGQK